MDVNIFTQIIANLGFPIACVIALFWSWSKEREDHKAELQAVTEALNNNTLALTRLEAMISTEKGEKN